MIMPVKNDILTIYFENDVIVKGIVDRCIEVTNSIYSEKFYRVTFLKILDGKRWKEYFNRKNFYEEYTFYEDNYEVICHKLLKTKIGELIYG